VVAWKHQLSGNKREGRAVVRAELLDDDGRTIVARVMIGRDSLAWAWVLGCPIGPFLTLRRAKLACETEYRKCRQAMLKFRRRNK
jgi:hypothetical protein